MELKGMTKRDLGEIALKLLGVWALVRAVAYLGELPFVITVMVTQREFHSLSFGFLPLFLLWLLAGGVLIAFAKVFSTKLFSNDGTFEPLSNISRDEFHGIAFSVVGIFITLLAVSEMLGRIVTITMIIGFPQEGVTVGASAALRQMPETVVKLLLGLFLFFRSRVIVGIWRHFHERYGGPRPLSE